MGDPAGAIERAIFIALLLDEAVSQSGGASAHDRWPKLSMPRQDAAGGVE